MDFDLHGHTRLVKMLHACASEPASLSSHAGRALRRFVILGHNCLLCEMKGLEAVSFQQDAIYRALGPERGTRVGNKR